MLISEIAASLDKGFITVQASTSNQKLISFASSG
jgi:hypothetical protein